MVINVRNDQRVGMESFNHYIYFMIMNDLNLSHTFKQLFIIDWFIIFVAIGLEKMKFCFGICDEIVSPSDFVIVAWTHAYSFSRLMVFCFELVELSMNLGNIVDKVDKEDKLVENWTRGEVNPH